MVGEAQQRVERRELRVGLNNDRRDLFDWISSLSPEIIVTSSGRFVIDSTDFLISMS